MEKLQENRWVKQIIFYRYKALIDKIAVTYNLSMDQKNAIEKHILCSDWLD
jgi:hypothetical protein